MPALPEVADRIVELAIGGRSEPRPYKYATFYVEAD